MGTPQSEILGPQRLRYWWQSHDLESDGTQWMWFLSGNDWCGYGSTLDSQETWTVSKTENDHKSQKTAWNLTHTLIDGPNAVRRSIRFAPSRPQHPLPVQQVLLCPCALSA